MWRRCTILRKHPKTSQVSRSAFKRSTSSSALVLPHASLNTKAGALLPIVAFSCALSSTGRSPESQSAHPHCAEEELYSVIEPYNTGYFSVSEGHQLYYEECGNSHGKPVLIVHGGPGSGCRESMRCYHNPQKYRIILVDQRGSGRSKPRGSLHQNTGNAIYASMQARTWHLVDDMEKLRQHLRVDRWQVFGGSWGSTLSLAYAITHPDRVTELILRGIFTLRKKEIDFFYQSGANFVYPDRWEEFVKIIPTEEREDLVLAYHKRLNSPDSNVRIPAALAWTTWEKTTSNLCPPTDAAEKSMNDSEFAETFARIENHYFINKGFFPSDSFLIDNVTRIRHIPTIIVQGRYDVVCPMQTAWDLHKAFPEAELRVVQTAGHSALEPGIAKELVQATTKFESSCNSQSDQ